MLCHIYRSPRRDLTYLFVEQRDDFARVPEPLLRGFGTPEWVMQVELSPGRALARVSADEVRENIARQGFYLQMPPKDPSLVAGL
jgi:uncharacterized protein YcgL (UPF0745 family)